METFILQLLHDKGIPADLDESVQNQLISDLTEQLENLINQRIIESLSSEQVESMQALVDSEPNNIDALQQFIADNVPNKEEIVTKTLMEFRALYLGAKA